MRGRLRQVRADLSYPQLRFVRKTLARIDLTHWLDPP